MKNVVTFLIVFSLIGCAGKPVNIKIKNPPSPLDPSKEKVIQATASGLQILCFFPSGVNTRHQRAYDSLLLKAGDSYIYDIELRERWNFFFIGTWYISTFRAKIYPRHSQDELEMIIEDLKDEIKELKHN